MTRCRLPPFCLLDCLFIPCGTTSSTSVLFWTANGTIGNGVRLGGHPQLSSAAVQS